MYDAMYDAMELMIDLCNDPDQKRALNCMQDMLCDFYSQKWYDSSEAKNRRFVESYMDAWDIPK